MLDNIRPIQELRGLSRRRGRVYQTRTVDPLLVEQSIVEGWTEHRKHKKSVSLIRKKPHYEQLEDRVWSLLYRLGFSHLSDAGGGILTIDSEAPDGPKTKLDVVGIDDEIAIAIECKSSEKPSKRPQFQEELGKHALIREKFSHAINSQFPVAAKRQVVLAMFTENIILTDNDKARAAEAKILIFDEQDIAYYEALAKHLGPAAKYQLFSDMLPGKPVPGLQIRVPAVRTKMGGYNCYTFLVSPQYLLKISYVSHRSKGKASDVNTYQRMISKARLSKIKQYINDDGIFPTNIVINLDKKRVQFERIHQEEDSSQEQSGLLGWLEIRPSYKSAWIIDGQHRLFAYSGHPKAAKGLLSVLAFEGLLPSKQAALFIDINAKQKAVKQSLLQELYAELHWDAQDPQLRVRAIISKAIQELDADPESPLCQRIQKADEARDEVRCITLNSIYSAIEKTEFYIVKEKRGQVIEYGPLWAGDNEATLKRTVYVLKNWLGVIKESALDWWGKGSAEGGGLAMNDGVASCINVLRSVFQFLDSKGQKLLHLDNEDLFSCIRPYAEALGNYLGSHSEDERKRFRDLRALQGLMVRTRRCQAGIRARMPSFNPPGLDEFLQLEKAQTNVQAKEIIDRIEKQLQETVLSELRTEFGQQESEWWIFGVAKQVRLDVTKRFEEDDGKRGGKECYFDLIDYKKIALANWGLFEPLLAYGKKGNKEAKLSWLVFVNEKRNIVSHPSSGVTLSLDDLSKLQEYETFLRERIEGIDGTSGKSELPAESQDEDGLAATTD